MLQDVLQQGMPLVALAQASAPDDWAEAVITIIVGVLSWWIGRERGKRKR